MRWAVRECRGIGRAVRAAPVRIAVAPYPIAPVARVRVASVVRHPVVQAAPGPVAGERHLPSVWGSASAVPDCRRAVRAPLTRWRASSSRGPVPSARRRAPAARAGGWPSSAQGRRREPDARAAASALMRTARSHRSRPPVRMRLHLMRFGGSFRRIARRTWPPPFVELHNADRT